MGLLDSLLDALKSGNKSSSNSDEREFGGVRGFIGYGKNKQDGSHDHRYNKGGDRTPSQRDGDKKRSKE